MENSIEKAVNFQKLFFERLQDVPEFKQEERRERASDFLGIGIFEIKKEARILLLKQQGFLSEWQIFLSAKNKDGNLSHQDLINELLSLDNHLVAENIVRAKIIEDGESNLWVLLDEASLNFLKSKKLKDDKEEHNFIDSLQKYFIKGVFGRTLILNNSSRKYESIFKKIYTSNLVLNHEENLILLNMAKKYEMTNNQFLRFHLMAKEILKHSRKTNTPIEKTLSNIAETVMEE
jgi:hypothetical protein